MPFSTVQKIAMEKLEERMAKQLYRLTKQLFLSKIRFLDRDTMLVVDMHRMELNDTENPSVLS